MSWEPTKAELVGRASRAFVAEDYPAALDYARQVLRDDLDQVEALETSKGALCPGSVQQSRYPVLPTGLPPQHRALAGKDC